VGLKNKKSISLVAALASTILGLLPAQAQAANLITELDNTVVTIHDYSTINSKITAKSSPAVIQQAVSAMNQQLFTVKAALTPFDADLTKSWVYLGRTSNGTYPARAILRQFDLTAFAWYNFEISAQKEITACYKNISTSKQCVLKFHAKNKKNELARYGKVSAQLKIIEQWRLAAKK
jgi:hypothetical protein